MKKIQYALMVPVMLFPLLAGAATPSFNCSKASSDVETMICKDNGLAALDNKMSSAYKTAVKNLSSKDAKKLRTNQIGWIKGRNECWKSSDANDCIKQEYELRINELKTCTAGTHFALQSGSVNCN